MRQKRTRWLRGAAAVALLIAAGGPALCAQPAATAPEPVKITSFSGAYLAARVAEVDNDLDGAISYYRTALAFDPDNDQLRSSLFLALMTKGRFDEALPFADRLKDELDMGRFARLALSADAFRRNDFKAVAPLIEPASDSDLDVLVATALSAWADLGAGEGEAALKRLDGIEGPDWFRLFVAFHKGLIAEHAGRADTADRAYQSAVDDVSAGAASPETWMRAAEAYAGFLVRAGRKDAALAVLDKADEFVTGRQPLSDLRERIGKGKAVPPLVADASAGASEILLNLATALNRGGGGGEAFVRLYLQYALALKPDSDVVLVQLAAVAEQMESPAEAIALYRRIPATSSLKRAADLQLGLNLADLDRHDEAVKELERLLAAEPDDMRGYLALGGVFSSKQDYKNAGEVYDRAVQRIEANPIQLPGQAGARSHWNIYYQRGIAYERQKQWTKAEPNFRKALELYPNQPQVLNYLGYSMIDMNMNLEEGMGMIRKAVELRPSDGYIVDSLGWAHYKLGQFEDAVRELERAVSLKPDDPILNDHLGDAYWRAGRRLEATFQWSHARDMKPEPDLLAEVEKKLAQGLPPQPDKAVAGDQAPPPAVAPAPSDPEKRSEAVPAKPEQRSEAAAASPAVVPVSYKVRPGQSLWSIAVQELGSGSRYQEIIELNPQIDPARLMPGQELTLPSSR